VLRLRAVAALLALCLVAAGAGWSGATTADAAPGPAATTRAPATVATDDAAFDGSVDETIDAVQAYWADAYPEIYGSTYDPIPDDRLFPYSESSPPPGCGTSGDTPYEEVAGNAFYCPAFRGGGDFVAWDTQELFPQLEREHGPFAVALVLAHEWGHAIQARADVQASTLFMEQQADCFAGSWARSVADGDTDLSLGSDDLDTALSGFLELRDPPGVDPSQGGAHGNAFDRVRAFQDGFEGNASSCRDYESDPPNVTEAGYDSQVDADNGGDLPFADIIDALEPALDGYWQDAAGSDAAVADIAAGSPSSCDSGSDHGVLTDDVVYCGTDDRIVYREDALVAAYEDAGDFGVGMLLAAAWSSAAQHALDRPVGTDDAHLEADCLTGAWTGAVYHGDLPRTIELSLSPGDLDEAVLVFVTFEGRGVTTAFERVRAFRTGFDGGADACLSTSGDRPSV
jgi:predicted metalloprotease